LGTRVGAPVDTQPPARWSADWIELDEDDAALRARLGQRRRPARARQPTDVPSGEHLARFSVGPAAFGASLEIA
jgi:hypothetical protein